MKGDPLVSIRCLVYNHEPYLRQCLDGFVMQKTTFPFEAIVHDDASTDGSAAIIREYAEKYPDIIKPIFETENQYSKQDGSLGKNIRAVANPNAKYIATCEGDDYWTDPNKLQLQVDFLESHPDYYMTCHAFKEYYEDTNEFKPYPFIKGLSFDGFKNREYCTPDLDDFFYTGWFTQILTIVRRNEPYIEENKFGQYKLFYDYISCYYMLKKGKCALFRDVMGVYRRQNGGVSTGRDEEKWYDDCLANYYVLYRLEHDKRVLPLINDIFKGKVGTMVKQLKFKKLIMMTIRHIRNTSFRDALYAYAGFLKYVIARCLRIK